MASQHRRARPVAALLIAFALSIGWAATPTPADAGLPTWTGGINLYRSGVFTTQRSWLWCTAADVQIMRNMKFRRADHSRANQSRYFSYMRSRNRYSLPVSAGVDPQGWTAGLRRYVDDRYRLTSSSTFVGALRLAVIRMRMTNLPVALAVARGNHGWVLHGFTATADPARTDDFRITSVRVTGSLWGLQNRSFGYDMRPNTKLFPYQLKRFFTPWWYAPKRMIWDGRYVSIQPVPFRSTSSSAAGAAGLGASPAPSASVAASAVPAPATAFATKPLPATAGPEVATAAGVAGIVRSPSTAPAVPPANAPPIPVGVMVAVLVVGAGGLVPLLLARAGDRPRSARGFRDPRAGWSS